MPYRNPVTGAVYDDDGTLLEQITFGESQVDDDDGDDGFEPEPQPKRQRNFRRDLENRSKKANTRAQEAQDRAEQAERELAFYKAGIDPDDARAKYFVRGYDGDLTADAIRAAAQEIGLGAGQQQQAAPSAEQQAFERMANATAGNAAPGARDYDAEMAALRDLPAAEGLPKLLALAREKGLDIVNQ